jgi:hypothetical protein
MKLHDVLRIGDLFAAKGWSTEIDGDEQFPSLFERFCKMSARLADDERELVIKLSHGYVRVPPSANIATLGASWTKLVQSLPPTIKTLGVSPLLKPRSKRPKSSDALFYVARGMEARLRQNTPAALVFRASASKFFKTPTAPGSTALVLLDDYVGSGDTALDAIAHLRKQAPQSNTDVIILALVAQVNATARIQASNAQLVAGLFVDQAISKNPGIVNTEEAIEKMYKIGRRLRVSKAEALGYAATEAVVTMGRTPNNTFPVFWTNRKVKGRIWDSPFTRYTDRGL